jgi:uncharacterized membrane protein YbhN (UPF0104 family)
MPKLLKKILSLISYLVLAGIIIGLIFYYGKDIYAIFAHVKWWLICVMISLQIPMIALGGYAFQILCKRFDIQLRWQDWAGLSFIANFLNQLLPYRPGVGFRYLYLRQHYQMKSAQFIYVMLVYFLLTLIISAGFTIIGWLFGNLPQNFNNITLVALLVIILVCSFIFWLKTTQSRHANENFPLYLPHQLIQKTLQAIHLLINNPVILFSSCLTLFFVNLLTAVIFHVTFIAVSAPMPFSDCIFLVGIITIAMLFPITPGNIGVLETLLGTLTQLMYNDFSLGFSVSALYRASQWIPSIILGTSFSMLLAGSIIPDFKARKLGGKRSVD